MYIVTLTLCCCSQGCQSIRKRVRVLICISPLGEGRVNENDVKIAQSPPPTSPNGEASPAQKMQNGLIPETRPTPAKDKTAVAEEKASKAAPEAVATSQKKVEGTSKDDQKGQSKNPQNGLNVQNGLAGKSDGSAEGKATAEKHKPQGDCVVCGHLARNLCSGCKSVFYCSR